MLYIGPTHLQLIRLFTIELKLHPGRTVSKINKDSPLTSVWNKIRKLQGKYVPQPLPSLVVNNSVVSDPKEVSDFLAEHFSKISSEKSFSKDFGDSASF